MADFDASSAVPADGFDPASAVPVDIAPARSSATGELARSLGRAALVGLPTSLGKAAQFVNDAIGKPGSYLQTAGQGLVQSAQTRGELPWLQRHPDEHGTLLNTVGDVVEGSGAFLPGMAASVVPGAQALAPALLAAGGAVQGLEAGQGTKERVRAAGGSEEDANKAGAANAALTTGVNLAGGAIASRLLGVASPAFTKFTGGLLAKDGAQLADEVLGQLTGSQGALTAVAKQLPRSIAEVTGLGAGQAAGQAAIEQAYGVQGPSPTEAAVASLGPSAVAGALMGAAAIPGRMVGNRLARQDAARLSGAETAPELRSQLADQYAAALQRVNPDAAQAFRDNAAVAIREGMPLSLDNGLFQSGAVTPPVPEAPPAPQLALPLLPDNPMVVFPDGTVGRREEVEAYIKGLPEDQQVAARAQLYGMGAQPARPAEPVATPAEAVPDLAQQVAGARDVHAQVKQALVDAGQTPAVPLSRAEFGEWAGLTGQQLTRAYRQYLADPATERQLMVRDATAYDAMRARQQAEDAARAAEPPPELNKLVDEQPPAEPPPPNPAMAEALKRAQIDAALRERQTAPAAELEALANVGRGARTAEDALAGRITPDENAPKQRMEIDTDLQTVQAADTEAWRKQDVARVNKALQDAGVLDAKTHADQIDALQKAVDAQKKQTVTGDRLRMLLDQWKAARPETPAEAPPVEPAAPEHAAPEPVKPVEAVPPAATPEAVAPTQAARLSSPAPETAPLAENIPPVAPELPEQPLHTESLSGEMPNQLTEEPAVRAELPADMPERKGAMQAKVNAVLADLAQRKDSLSPEDVALRDRARSLRKVLAEASYLTEPELRTMEGHVEALRPERSLLASTDVVNPDVLAPTARLGDTLDRLAQNGSTPWVQQLARELSPLVGHVTLERGGVHPNGDLGSYNPSTGRVTINAGGESEHAVLHEASHAATEAALSRAESLTSPTNARDAQLLKAYRDLDKVRRQARAFEGAREQYGLQDVHEFVAELDSNAAFRDFLKTAQPKQTLWRRVIDGLGNLLGLTPDGRNALEQAIDARNQLYSNLRGLREFDASPAGAAEVTDRTIRALSKAADDEGLIDKLNLRALPRAIYNELLGWKTVDFIAHQMDAWPEMVQAGVSRAVNAYRAARDSRRIVAEHVSDTLGKYVASGEQALRQTKAPREWGGKMMRIAGEASIMGFDYRKNFADNLKERPDLNPADKAYIDQIHHEFTRLKAAQPKLAEALVEGEKQNRTGLIQQTASLAKMLLESHAGIAQRLETELSRIDPASADYARAQDRLKIARSEGELAARFARGLDFMDAGLRKEPNAKPDFFLDGASSALHGRLSELFKATQALPEGNPLRGHLAELANLYYTQVRNPYFSLGRSGDYFVSVKFKNMDAATQAKLEQALAGTNKILGNLTGPGAADHAFFRVDSLDQAVGLFNKLKNAAGDKIELNQSARGKLADHDMMSVAGVTPALRQLAGSLHDLIDTDPRFQSEQGRAMAQEMKAALTRQLMSMLPETSARSAKMQRRGVPGYDADFFGNFARRASGMVQDLSNVYTNRAFGDALNQLTESVSGLNRTGDPETAVRAQMVADEINRRYANSLKRIDNQAVNLINSFGHSFYLAASPAFFIRTMAQPFHRGVPLLGSRYGFIPAAKEMAGATGTALRVVANTIAKGWAEGGARGVLDTGMQLDDLNLPAADKAFLQEMHDRGVFKLGQAQQLQHAITGGTQLQRDLARLASMTAQYAEMTNRIVVGLAAFRMASRDRRMSPQAATEWAAKAVNNVMDNFDIDNTARQIGKFGFAGKVTPLMTSFMNYQLQTMQQLARTVQDGYFGKDASPEGLARSKAARREFAGLMATTMMISGVMGLPFANAFAGAYNALTKDRDDPGDVRSDIRNFLSDSLGTGMGNIIARGLGETINMDTSTFGLQDLLPGSQWLADRRTAQDALESQSQQLLGPALNAGIDLLLGYEKIRNGYLVKGIEQMLPSGLKPYYKAAELAGVLGPGGYTDSKGNPLPMKDPGSWGILLQGLGFRTAEKATRDDAAFEANTNQQLLERRRGIINDKLYKAALVGGEDIGDVIGQIMDYNAKNPFQPITDPVAAIRQRVMANALGSLSGLGMPMTKKQFPVFNEQFAYAAMPREE